MIINITTEVIADLKKSKKTGKRKYSSARFLLKD